MRYLITFSYDGSCFKGFQRQKNLFTIQGLIEEELTKINNNNYVKIHASGRTDAGVHALNQKAHFDLETLVKPNNLKEILNKRLEGKIYIKKVEQVEPTFHARYNCTLKEYHYFLNTKEYNPFMRNYIYQYNKKLNIKKMKKALKIFQGTHDFKALCNNAKERTNFVRTIYQIKLKETNGIIEIIVVGNGFLKQMVRNIVGILIKVGEESITNIDITKILENKTRTYHIKTSPSCGLYLWDVYY